MSCIFLELERKGRSHHHILYAELGLREVVEMQRLDASETVTPELDAEPWLNAVIAALKA